MGGSESWTADLGRTRDALAIVGGRPIASDQEIEFLDPWRGDVVSRVARSSEATVDLAVNEALRVQPLIAALPVAERAAILRRAADLIEERSDAIALTITREIGKAIKSTTKEVRRSAWTFRAAATAAETMAGEVPVTSAMPGGAGLLALTLRVPVGVVGAITPFNAPFNLVAHKVAPSFAAGNATVVKPASQTALTAIDLAGILADAGAPVGAVGIVPGDRTTVKSMLGHPGIGMFTFTGGRTAGAVVAANAGLRRVTLELGGNSPNIVYRDADLDVAARECVAGGFANTGQSCNSVQRVFVHEGVADAFLDRVQRATEGLKIGDPFERDTDVGTLVDVKAAERVSEWLSEACSRGARILVGGQREGALLQPTVVLDAPDDSRLVCDEVFGPVIVVLRYATLEEAIARANASAFGLQAAVFTSSLAVALQAANCLAAGGVLVNRSTNFRLDHLPYGGVKESGIGREGPAYAMDEMTERKLVVLDPGRLDG